MAGDEAGWGDGGHTELPDKTKKFSNKDLPRASTHVGELVRPVWGKGLWSLGERKMGMGQECSGVTQLPLRPSCRRQNGGLEG